MFIRIFNMIVDRHKKQKYQLNEKINKFLIKEDKQMSEMHLRHPRFTFSVYGQFTKIKERI